MIFGQTADPQINVIDRTIQLLQLGLERRIGSDLGEALDLGQSVGGPYGIVIGQAVVAASLNVQAGQIESAAARRSEQEVAHAVDDGGIDLGARVGRQIFQKR